MTLPTQNIAPIQFKPESPDLVFRLNQRIAAEILQVNPDSAILSINGTKIIARIDTNNQAVELSEKKFAQFLVKGFTNDTVELQLLNNDTSTNTNQIKLQNHDVASALLSKIGLSVNKENLTIMLALLNNKIIPDKSIFAELMTNLNMLNNWGINEAQAAAYLLAHGIPLSHGTLDLILSEQKNISNTLNVLLNDLNQLEQLSSTSPAIAHQIKKSLFFLRSCVLRWNHDRNNIAGDLNKIIQQFTDSIESNLSRTITNRSDLTSENNIMTLIQLRKSMINSGQFDTAHNIDILLDSLRYYQLINSPSKNRMTPDRWVTLEIPLLIANGSVIESSSLKELQNANLKIAYRREGNKDIIDPDYTRIKLQLDLKDNNFLEVDLSIVSHQISAKFITSSKIIHEKITNTLPSFSQNLSHLGYELKNSSVKITDKSNMQNFPYNNFLSKDKYKVNLIA